MAIDRAEYGPAGKCGLFQPTLKCANRAGLRIRPIGNADLSALAILIGFGTSQYNGETIFAEYAIFKVQTYNLRTAKCPSEPDQDQGPISEANQARVCGVHHRPNVIG